MKPIYEFNDFLKKTNWKSSIVHEKKNGLSLENFHFRLKRVSLRENVSLRVGLLYAYCAFNQKWPKH